MKKKVFSLMMTLVLAFMGVARAETIEIGTGTGTSYYVPFNSLYGYSFTEQVYSASDIGTAGNISSISFYLGTSNSVEQTNEIALYMKNVSRTSFSSTSDYETVTPGDVVYSGLWTIPANYTGWVTINLTTPFAYDGYSNLMVAMHEFTSGYSTRYFTYTSVTGASVQWYSDSYNPDPYNLGSYSGSSYVRSYLGNAQLEITAGGGGGQAVTVTIGDPTSTTTNSYLPTYSLYDYSFTQQIYTADEIGVGGSITAFGMWLRNTSNYARNLNVYMKEVSESTFANGSAWVSMSASDLVASGVLANGITDPVETTFTLNTPFAYSGNGNLVICVQDVTGSWSSGAAGVTFPAAGDQAIYAYRDGTVYDPAAPGVTGYTLTSKNVVRLDITTAGGGGIEDVLVAMQDDQVVNIINVGPRANGAWLEPFTFQLRNDGPRVTLTRMDFTPDEFFSIVEPELPLTVAHNDVVDVVLNTGTSTLNEWQFVALYDTRTAAIWPITAEPYDPACPDVVELAYDFGTITPGFSYQGIPANIAPTTLHDDYNMPFTDEPNNIPDGLDAVYKFTVDNDMMISAAVTQGANGKVALYTEDFNGEGGPMAHNYYQGIEMGAGGGAATPFEVQIGEGTSTSGYFPFYTLYNYSISAEIFTAAELEEAGVTSAPFTSLSWNATNSISQDQNNITIWMANVTDTEVPATSPLTAGMTKVYTGNLSQPTPTGWVEFVFNEGSFAWDGHSNVMILCQRNNGSWTSSISWQSHNPGFYARGYLYEDGSPYNMETTTYNWTRSNTVRANIIMKGGGRAAGNRDIVEIGEGTGTTYYFPIDNYFNYSCTEQIYTAEEIGTAGTINSISFYYNYGTAYNTPNVTMYMKNVARSSFASTSDHEPLAASDIVWTGDIAPTAAGWYTFTLNTPFQYDGTSNLLVAFYDGTSGYPGTSYNWRQTTSPGSANMALRCYSDSYNPNPYDLGSYSGSKVLYTYRSNVQIDITPGGGGTGIDYACGPVIDNLPVRPGTYYLLASSTDPDFEVTINGDNMPCPQVEGFAFNPQPADNEDEIEPGSVTLRWQIPAYATGWRLIFGTTYHPDPNHPQTVMYPEDGSFSTSLANSFTVRNLWNNNNYFWRVEFNNGGCEAGVSSPIWGFTTHLNIPQNLTAVDQTVFDDENIVLNWNAVVDRTFRTYYIYRDGVKVGETNTNMINASTYTDGPLPYNMGGYTYCVTAVYDEGESAPSNTVNVKVSGRGNVNGHVYEQDGTTGIAGATVTMVGPDEFGVNHTYNFTTNAQGYYSGAVYAGSYNGQAAKDGYQTITAPVQGNPIAITYDVTTSPVDYVLDENFDPVCGVIAQYYPDSLDPLSPYVKVYWGCGLPGSEIIEDFETGDFSMFDWQLDPTYPWSVTTTAPYEGIYCMKSGGAGVASVVSNMTVTVEIPADGEMSFFGKVSCESNFDFGRFFIDGVEMGSWSGAGNWTERTYNVTAGEHTFQWRYTKDSSVNSNDDCFYVDYINFYKQPEPPIPGMTYDFDNSTMQGWTSIDADGDGYGWYVASDIMSTGYGHNGSNDCVLSQSYYSGLVLYPDNYLVSPQVELGGLLRFYACAQDASYAAEHFGVAVSTTGNTNPSDFTMLQEWTMTAKAAKGGVMNNDADAMGHSRNGNNRAQGNWYEYTVDLSAYSGMGYVAIRHFNCSDMFYLDVDDITIGEPGKAVAGNTRSLHHYNIYRTNCYNDGPYTEENTVLLATNWPGDTIYIDIEWPELPAGIYKWGVGCVYAGNRGELYESPITWGEPTNVNRSFSTSEAAQMGPKVNKEVAADPQDKSRAYLQYCTETFSGGVGTGGGAVYWGVRFPAAELAPYAGQSLNAVGIFMDVDGDYGWTYSGTYTVNVHQGGATAPGSLVSTASQYLPGDMAWHDITLTTPVTIDASQDLWLCFYTPDIAYPMAGCDYVGNPNSDFLSLDGAVWEHAGDYGLNYTWMIRGFVDGEPGPGPGPGPNPNPGQSGISVVDFEGGEIPAGFDNTISNYPWVIWNSNPYSGSYCMASGNYNIASSESYIDATVEFVTDGSIDFFSRISSESVNYDWGAFYIDNVEQYREGGTTNWANRHYDVPAGTHTFRWYYRKDSSVNSGEDRYFIDEITFEGVAGGGNNLNWLAEPRESETVWSNCLDKGMYLGENEVDITVLLNSADSPEGVTVSFTNYNEAEQELYPMGSVVLDETGYYAWDLFRKGDYQVKIENEGYYDIIDSVSIWNPTSLRYVMTEIIYGVSDLYVSRTGWAMWTGHGDAPNPGPNPGPGGNGDSFSENFDAGMPAGWTTVDADGDGYTWVSSMNPGNYHNAGVDLTGTGHNSSTAYVISGSWANGTGQVLYPDNYLVSPQVTLAAGSTFSFWACAQDASYPADHFGVAISDNGTSGWTMVNEWTMTAKGTGAMSYGRDGDNRVQGNWYNYSVDLSAYAGQKYIAIRHFNCSDQFILNVDDIELTSGAKDGDRHLEYYKVMCESLDHEPIFNANTIHPFCQVATDELVEGEQYICKVAAVYSTGMSDWLECVWEYESCEHYAGTLNGVTIEGNEISWEYPGGGITPPPGQGDAFTESWDNGLNGWTLIDNDGDGHNWYPSSEAGNHSTAAVASHSGAGHLMGESYCNAGGALTPDDYVVAPQQYAIAAGSTFSFWACTQDVSYPSEHFGIAISTGSNTNASDFTTIAEWTITAKGAGKEIIGRNGKGTREGNWYQFSANLDNYAGQNVWIAVRHFGCTDMFILNIDDAELTSGAKSRAVVFDQAQYVTDPGAINGADASWTKNGQATWGPNANNASAYILADDFTLSAAASIDEIECYAYQTGSSTTSTFTGMFVQIYNGNPMSGGSIVWGDQTTNIMTSTEWTGCYRGSDGSMDMTRPIMRVVASNLNINLEAGTYYIGVSFTGSLGSGPWGAIQALPGVGNTGNGLQYTSSGWTTMTDSGSGETYGIPFILSGGGSGPVPPPATGDILGAMIFADGEWEAFVPYPTNTYVYEGEAQEVCVRIVYNGTAVLPSNNFYYAMSCEECEPFTPAPGTCEPGAPIHAELMEGNDDIKVWWGNAPQPPMAEWLYYDDGVYATSVGAGSTLYWGTMFPANALTPYAGTSLTKVAIFTSYACAATVNVYVGGAQPSGSPAASQNFNMMGDQEFMEITLNNPVQIDGTQNLWITFYQTGEDYPADACNDTGDANNRWVSVDGASWMDLATAGLPGYGWMIRGYVTNGAKGEQVSLPEFRGNVGGELGHTAVVSKPADLSFMHRNRATLVNYNVYRSTSATGDYVLLGTVEEDGSGYYEYIDSPATAGTYYYQVTAVYDDGCESEPAQAADDPSVNYVSETTDGINELDGEVSLYPNPTNGNVTIEASGMNRITVVSVLGRVTVMQ